MLKQYYSCFYIKKWNQDQVDIRTTEKAKGWKFPVHSKRNVYINEEQERSNHLVTPTLCW